MHRFFFTFLTALLIGSFSIESWGFASKEMILPEKRVTIYTPHIFNPKYFAFEFGFVTKKKLGKSYNYNAFAKAFIAEEFYTTDSELRAGALGAKAGVYLLTQPWFPIFLEMGIGYAKTSLHKDPWLGDREDSIHSKDLLLAEAGLFYLHREKLIFRATYQANGVDYFTKKFFVSIGFNY